MTANYNIYNAKCPTRVVLDRISDKWTNLILGALKDSPLRFNELRRRVDGISQKVLTSSLRSLEADGIVSRKIISDKPVAIAYSLTALGESLNEPISMLRAWAIEHIEEFDTLS